MTRRQWIALILGGGVAAAAYPVLVEPRWLELTNTTIPGARGLRNPIRILHLSDLHASFLVPMPLIEQAIAMGLEQRPDIICVTGDFISYRGDFDPEHYIHLLSRLSRAAPTYAVLGNHDGGAWAAPRLGYPEHRIVEEMLARSGIRLLHNRPETIRIGNSDLAVVGVGDLWNNEIDTRAAFSGVHPRTPTLLLSHNPDSKEVLANVPWDVMLCGHTHGGQVLIPFMGPQYAPVADRRFTAGLRGWRGRQIFVTRGVGSIGAVRFRCRPEVSILTLTS